MKPPFIHIITPHIWNNLNNIFLSVKMMVLSEEGYFDKTWTYSEKKIKILLLIKVMK